MKVAFITGITGQDGSYLSEFLLEKGYEVWGMIRRSSNFNTQRIDHIFHNPSLFLRYGDLTDSSNISKIFSEIKNRYSNNLDVLEVYNLGAMSHVKVSFEVPEYCGETDALGVLRLLDAVLSSDMKDKIRFYQASTSELYGKVQEIPQKESTPFYPQSPYGVAKLYGYWITKVYREAYNLFACNGVLHNHETIASATPMIFTHDKCCIDIKPIGEIVRNHTLPKAATVTGGQLVNEELEIYQEGEVKRDLFVWDDNDWTKVTFASGYKHDAINNPKHPKWVISKNSCYMATGTHMVIMDDGSEKEVKDLQLGDMVKLTTLDISLKSISDSEKSMDMLESEFMGLMVGDGYIDEKNKISFINSIQQLRGHVTDLWKHICSKHNKKYAQPHYYPSSSSFFPDRIVWLDFDDSTWYLDRTDFYNEDETKRIPQCILNSNQENQLAFLRGYNKAHGLKAGNGVKNFTTDSAVLACGLIYLLGRTTKQEYCINLEQTTRHGRPTSYYSINVNSSGQSIKGNPVDKADTVRQHINLGMSQRKIEKVTGISRGFIRKIQRGYQPTETHGKNIPANRVKKIIDADDYTGWFYDLTTESGTFCCGVGRGVVHNSPRRGPTFVTRKITIGLGKICRGETDRLVLGNLDAQRDWGHAKAFVEGMWLMLQADHPDDYVLATGEMHSVREFVEKAFALKGFEIKWKGSGINEIGYDSRTGRELIFVSDKYFRPAEVDQLLGDSTKARTELGWNPKITFDQLVKEMVDHDCQNKD